VLWAHDKDADVHLMAEPGATDADIWGARLQRFIRCKACGCVMQWNKLVLGDGTYTGVNARNFDPDELGAVRIRLLDGAETWKDVGSPTGSPNDRREASGPGRSKASQSRTAPRPWHGTRACLYS
jgi:hypothetical protein